MAPTTPSTRDRLNFFFLNVGHFLDHLFTLIFATVVLVLVKDWKLSYAELVPYATPGTSALGDALEPFLPHHDGFLLANHGATTVGPTLVLAHQRMESLEHAARILLTARMLGQVNALAAGEGDVLRAARRSARESWHSKTQGDDR